MRNPWYSNARHVKRLMRNRLKNPGTERPESSTGAQKTKTVQVAMAADSQLLEARNAHHFFTRFTKLPCEDNIPASAVIRSFESFFFFFSFCLADFPFAAIPRPSFSRILSSSLLSEKASVVDSIIRIFLRIFWVIYVPWYLAASTLIILFLEMLKFSNSFFVLKEKDLGKKILNLQEYFICQFENLKMNSNFQQTYMSN